MSNLVNSRRGLILGAGLTGLSLARYCRRKNYQFSIFDTRQEPPLAKQIIDDFGNKVLDKRHINDIDFTEFDFIFISPGFDTRIIDLDTAKQKGVLISSDIELFIQETRSRVIGITGSNGKSTVVDLLQKALQSIGFSCIAAGNIGLPVLDLLEIDTPDFLILELSSFQLDLIQDINIEVGAILNISPDHIDRHGSYDNYIKAKQKIYDFSQIYVFNSDDRHTQPSRLSNPSISFGTTGRIEVALTNNVPSVVYQKNWLFDESKSTLKGTHNFYNFAAVLACLDALSVPLDDKIISTLINYEGLDHRCKKIESHDGINWINDSKGTNTGSTIAAIKSYRAHAHHLFLIAGGDSKGADLSDLVSCIKSQVDHTWLIGKDAMRFKQQLNEQATYSETLDNAVREIKLKARKGDTVLLSPGCASTDQYTNFLERGKHFAKLIKEAS